MLNTARVMPSHNRCRQIYFHGILRSWQAIYVNADIECIIQTLGVI